jgi:hypothetical protein
MGQHLERKNEGGLEQYIEIELKKLMSSMKHSKMNIYSHLITIPD